MSEVIFDLFEESYLFGKMEISDILTFISIVLAIVGGFFALYRWTKSAQLKRAEYIDSLTEKMRTDDDIKKSIHILEYDSRWFTPNYFNSEFEFKMDKTLSFLSYICYLKSRRIISKKEFDFLKYRIVRTLRNHQVLQYFYFLYWFSKIHKVPMSFVYLLEYGEKNRLIDKSFYDRSYFENKTFYDHDFTSKI